jgi:hypothetical protein
LTAADHKKNPVISGVKKKTKAVFFWSMKSGELKKNLLCFGRVAQMASSFASTFCSFPGAEKFR